MQQLCEVSLKTYLAADNPFDVVSRPQVCKRCGQRDCFHRHTTYERYVEQKLVSVARFICCACRLTVSLLPSFVLPYRSRLVKKLDAYFMAGEQQRPMMSDHEALRCYWRQWVQHMAAIHRDTGWPPGQGLEREPRRYWRQLREVAGSIETAQRVLVARYGISLLRRYGCHCC